MTSHVTSRVTEREVTKQNKNKNKNKNIYNISSNEDIVETSEKTSEVPDRKSERLSYDEIMKDFHTTCPDLPGIRALNDARKTKIRSLVKELDKLKIFPGVEPEKKLHVIFQAAQNSDFLSGRSGKWNGCSFDWLINKTNALKVLEGQYQNKGGVSNAGRTDQRHNQEDVSGSDRTTSEALERFRRNRTGV